MWMALALVLTMAAWGMVWAQDGLYVISTAKGKYAPVPKTGQTASYATGDDGDLQKGVASPTPRFTDHGDGTVTDNLTGLMWQKNANCIAAYYPGFDNDNVPGDGKVTWAHALDFVAGINAGTYPLGGGGYHDWRLPNVRELQSLIDYGRSYPALPEGHPFTGVPWGDYHWSSTTFAPDENLAFDAAIGGNGIADPVNKFNEFDYVWCVRGGK
jgi:hypothetical protein